jgi:hypothetical protein
MDKVRVYLIKASKTIEGTTSELSAQIGNQINSDKESVERKNMCETEMIIR